ncbi:MAG TPA: response regulator [Microvirga sp.]|jgi:DNA-binding response OmpR family regulator
MTVLTHRPSLVLLLEDNFIIGLALEDDLRDQGYRVEVVSSCAAALEWLRTFTPDAAILDVSLNGEICRDVADQLHATGVPFLVYSARRVDEGLLPTYPGVAWLEKPAHRTLLLAALQRLLEPCQPASRP